MGDVAGFVLSWGGFIYGFIPLWVLPAVSFLIWVRSKHTYDDYFSPNWHLTGRVYGALGHRTHRQVVKEMS